jgi:hypothetical protein
MLAHHPITGQPIRILRTNAQLYESNKTLLWVRSDMENQQKSCRYMTVISEPDVTIQPDVIVIPREDTFDTWKSKLQTVCSDSSSILVCVTNDVAAQAEAAGFTYARMFRRDELFDMYPYLGEPLRDSDCLEKVIFAFAHILRCIQIKWTSTINRDEFDFGTAAIYDAWKKALNGHLTNDLHIPNMWLIQQYFKSTTVRRSREIQTCLQKNLECDLIDHILLLNEMEYSDLPQHPKLQTSILGHRLTYYDVLKTIQERIPAGDFVIFANSDIYFDNSLQYCWRIGLCEQSLFLALLRWEESTGAIFGPRSDSQDAWIVARDCIASMSLKSDEFGFPFGKSGCDNALSLLMLRHKFSVANPAYSIRSWHLHSSNIRTYDPKDILYRPHYLYLDPNHIQSFSVCRDLSKYTPPANIVSVWNTRIGGRSFPRRILGVDDTALQTICTMLHRQSEGFLNVSPHMANMWTGTGSAGDLYYIEDGAFVSTEGLVSTWNELLLGTYDEWVKGWQSASLSTIMPSIHVPHFIAAGLGHEAQKSLGSWCLLYLARVLAVRECIRKCGGIEPEFLVPSFPEMNDFLYDCNWGDRSRITIVPVLENMNYYSEHVWVLSPVSNGSPQICSEDIDMLRSLLPVSATARSGDVPIAVFCTETDDSVFSKSFCAQIAEYVLQNKWDIRYVDKDTSVRELRQAFSGASWIFGRGQVLEWIWYAQPGTTVMEFMSDSYPSGMVIHLAGAAKLRYIVGVMKNEPIEYQRQHCLEDIQKAIQAYGFNEILSIKRSGGAKTPTVIIPRGAALQGIWSHSGDTFREIVEIWREREYVKIDYTESSGYCWWGGIGEILLYDRPTPRWWDSTQSYQLALFGNCAPPGPDTGRQSVWGFWPRSPRSVEVINLLGLNMRGYTERKLLSLFLGKVENGVQRAHRTAEDWSTCVELFSMPIDPTGAPYPYTKEQYLEKLCNTKFGLCLPGYGPKCNREIEYFACGVVPIVTPGVDMKGYLVPPVEGIHYLTAKSPADVTDVISKITPLLWTRMSIAGRRWWTNYASAEGLFRLTWGRIEQCRPFLECGGIPKTYSM